MTSQTDTHDMIVVHRVFRRESSLLPRLIAAVRPGDVARARVLVAHLDDYQEGLHEHHTGEDELLWPTLLARVDLEADLVLRMERQHAVVAESLARIGELARLWAVDAAATSRDELIAALTEHAVLLTEHLGDEESLILPLAGEHLTQAEWGRLGERFRTHTPKDKLLLFLGALLEDATPQERAEMLGGLPLPARLAWHLIGKRKYAQRVRLVRGG